MSDHSLIEAQVHLPELAARAKAGEEIVIAMEDGVRLVLHRLAREDLPEIPPVPERNGPDMEAWFRKVRVGRIVPGAPNAAELIRQMRDEGY
jgi:antitoxin (DNA-binding transcriptional repressor) of toxin-antitoxin stability system